MLPTLISLARHAGRAIMEIYQSDFAIGRKDDNSPVTEADRIAEEIIIKGLRTLTPHTDIIAEEQIAASGLPVKDISDHFWLVDPLDGTKEFLKRNGEFTVNIALIKNSEPVLGVIYLPAEDTCYWNDTGGAYRSHHGQAPEKISTRAIPAEGATLLSSRSHDDNPDLSILNGINIAHQIFAGSSLKFCRLAEGKADLYLRLKPTMEWDIAAGHAILKAAGGQVTLLNGSPMMYGKTGFRNPHFLARGAR